MPYGIRKGTLDHENPTEVREIHFDKVWTGILQPAVPASFETKRADELRRSGLIDRLYIEWLFGADVVLADLTFGNPNVYYELGIRQALSKKGTVLVACRGTRLPFDVRNQTVLEYPYFEAPDLASFQKTLAETIDNAVREAIDSPVHVFLPDLFVGRFEAGENPVLQAKELAGRVEELEEELRSLQGVRNEHRLVAKIEDASSAGRLLALLPLVRKTASPSVSLLESFAVKLRKYGCIGEALEILLRALENEPEDSEILREIGFVYRKKGEQFYPEAERYLRRALQANDSDPELLGMLGGLLKRRGELREALKLYERAHEIEPENLYPLVNLGGMRAALGERADAEYWYEKLIRLCEEAIQSGRADYWTYLCLGEAAAVSGRSDAAGDAYRTAVEMGVPVEDLRSATEQLHFLVSRGFEAASLRTVLSFTDNLIRKAQQ
jgi:tetratricopeptide (TPR) repeat protein